MTETALISKNSKLDGVIHSMRVAKVRVTNFGPGRFLRLFVSLSDKSGVPRVTKAELEPSADGFMTHGDGCRIGCRSSPGDGRLASQYSR